MSGELLGNIKQGLVFIISAPAGTGKTTLVQMLVRAFPCVVESVSYTTRPMRPGEIPGKHYHFVSVEQFEEMIAANLFLEYVSLYNHYYGTTRASVTEQQKQGKHVILVIDTQGALQLKDKLEATFIFIQPPSLAVLRGRLMARKTENVGDMTLRLVWAEQELLAVPYYDYTIINEDLSIAYQVLLSILVAEEHRIRTVQRS
jgi:guanylate kinase